MSKLEKLPAPVLKALAAVASHFPKQILGLRYRRWTGKKMNWRKPEDLQQYILATIINASADKERLTLLGRLADKIGVRGYVDTTIGPGHLPELYGTWESAAEIDWSTLPEKFVIKTNNSCGTNIIVRNKAELDLAATARKLDRWLAFPYGELSGQPHYTVIPPRILAEELLEETPGTQELPRDYKVFCFRGEPRYILCYGERSVNRHDTHDIAYSTDWKRLDNIVKSLVAKELPRPEGLESMVEMARKLSHGFDFVRVDFYLIGGRPVLGEMSFTPDVVQNTTPEYLREALKFV